MTQDIFCLILAFYLPSTMHIDGAAAAAAWAVQAQPTSLRHRSIPRIPKGARTGVLLCNIEKTSSLAALYLHRQCCCAAAPVQPITPTGQALSEGSQLQQMMRLWPTQISAICYCPHTPYNSPLLYYRAPFHQYGTP